MISHNMEDVRAVADRIVVLRLGRNNGVFTPKSSNAELVGAITGATDNAVSRRAAPPRRRKPRRPGHERHASRRCCSTAATAASPMPRGCRARSRGFLDRVRSGDLGSLPVVVGLVLIWTVFYSLNPIFLSPNNMVNLFFDCSVVGVISLGIVCVLLLGEIDLSVGSMSGVASALLGVIWVNQGMPVLVAVAAALALGACVGAIYATLRTRLVDAELRLDALGAARAARAAALHARLDRLDQPALRIRRSSASASSSSCRPGCRTGWR